MNPVKVGIVIKTLRLQAGYTQHDLAAWLDVTDQAVSKWERGLSVPDISIITKLAILLNIDVDNLLEGNIFYLEKAWQGVLILKENEEIFSGAEVYGKPLVYIYLSYFMLAGIGRIYVSCSQRDKQFIEERIGDGKRYGIKLTFLESTEETLPQAGNTMVVYNNPFVYGPNLTKYFHRAMSRINGISVLTVDKAIGNRENKVFCDKNRIVRNIDNGCIEQFCVPIVFFPKNFFKQIKRVESITELAPLYAEPMGNGMIEYSITDEDSLWDTSTFLRYLKKRLGKEVYDLTEVAKKRNFTTK